MVSSAATEIMSYYFITEREKLISSAKEASISRLFGGIHFKSDLSEGLNLGSQIGKLIVEKIKNETDLRGNIIDTPISQFLDAPIMPKY